MKITYSGKDIFIPGTTPPAPKFDARDLVTEIELLMANYRLDFLKVEGADAVPPSKSK